MRILVTGADGYLGSLVSPALAAQGHSVIGVDAGFFRSAWLNLAPSWAPETLQRDIRDLDIAFLDGFEAVVHLGELSNDPLGALDPLLTEEINHQGSARLARLAKAAGVRRFVYMSSCSVYGAAEGIVDEKSPLRPQTAYASAKVLVEGALHGLADETFSPVVLRNATAFGASPRLRLDLVVNDLCAQAHVYGRLQLTGDGSPWRPLVHGLDIAAAIVLVLDAPVAAIHDVVLNVGDEGNNLRVRDIAGRVSDAFGGVPLALGEPGGDSRSYAVSFREIRRVLPTFRYAWSVERGIAQLRDAFRSNALTESDLSSGRYSRIANLRQLLATNQIDSALRWRLAEPAGPAIQPRRPLLSRAPQTSGTVSHSGTVPHT